MAGAMSRGDGFSTADIDVGFFRDLKVKKLAREHSEVFLSACSAYFGIVLHCWGCGQRQTAEDAWPELLPWSEEAVAALKAVGMLDRGSRLPVKVWDAWFGVATARRQLRRSAGSLGGQHKASNARAELQQSPSDALPVPSVPSVPSDSPQPPTGGPRRNGTNNRANGDSPRQREEQVKAGIMAAAAALNVGKSMPPGLKGEDR
jgi:hypothetical protein